VHDVQATTAIGGGKASKGRTSTAGIRQLRLVVKRTVNPRIVSRCNSAGRTDEEQAGEVV